MTSRYNQRITADIVPMEIADEDDDEDTGLPQVPNLKRNLLGDFGRPSVLEPPIPHEHMKVYLRIRPFSKDEIEKQEDQQCLTVETDRTVVTNPPKQSHFHKNMTRGNCKTTTRYTFSHIFNENTTQKDFFSSTMLGLVKDFIDGQNCLVFSYGVTSSGKTYTIQGNPRDAGILPRALDVLFNSINKRQWDSMDLKPKMFMDVARLTPDQEANERKVKDRVMKLSNDDDVDVMSLLGDDASDVSAMTNTTTCSESSNISTLDGKESLDSNDRIFAELESRVREEGKVSVDEQGQVRFSVWVSFAEIYNEQIYDLLEAIPKKKNIRRPCLKLSEDKNGSPYIKGLKYIQVSSADEAYKLLTIGQRNLQKACTKLNHQSSRSHCIFNIKILRVIDKDNPHVARVSMLTLCDLAGSERYGKTQTSGDRLKEAGNINTSLLTLGRCIETLRHNQAHKDHQRIIPFRESKLTRLFQNFFVGRGKAAMIVNVNQIASMFDETMHVFKFSAIASKVEVQQKPVFIKPKLPMAPTPAKIPRTSISWATPARNNNLRQHEAENVPLPEEDDLDEQSETDEQVYTQENIDELLGVIEQLQTDLENEIHSKYKLEKQIRKEVCEEMMKQFAEIEEHYSERIRIREQRAEELAERRLQLVIEAERSKRNEQIHEDDDDEWVSSVLLHQEKVKVEQRDETIKEMQKEIETLKAKDGKMQEGETQSSDVEKIKTLEEQLSKEQENSKKIEEMAKTIAEYEERIKSLEGELVKKQSQNEKDSDVIENLTQELQQSRQKIKEQEKEIGEMNDMLTEAGETFNQKETEINQLKELTQDYEKKMETQAEAIQVLERAAADSKVAMETADQSLSKREECVSSLQSDIRDLEAEVNKYRNKARFFEDQVVEKEQEAHQWKSKYEQDRDDHASSQEALIHGFNAEISNLKSQIFHFKTQLYGVKSPTKSPGGSIKSPDVRMRLFPMSPVDSCRKEIDTDAGDHSVLKSPMKEREHVKHHVGEQVKALQGELDKNGKMIIELEHALQMSRANVDDLEKRLVKDGEKRKEAELRVKELEVRLSTQGGGSVKEVCDDVVIDQTKKGVKEAVVMEMGEGDYVETEFVQIDSSSLEKKLNEKNIEIEQLNEKVKELEPLMKDYFSTSKKLTDHEKMLKELNAVMEEKDGTISECENKIKLLEEERSKLKQMLADKENAYEKLEEKFEEVKLLNDELKGMIDKTATDLQSKETELLLLSPKLEKMRKCSENENKSIEKLKKDVDEKSKEIEDLKLKLSNLKTSYKVKDTALREAAEKNGDFEFKINEFEINNQELQKQLQESANKLEDANYELEKNLKEVKVTGEELAVAKVDAEKCRRKVEESDRIIEELKVSLSDLESAVADKEMELCEKDKVLEERNELILKLQSDSENQSIEYVEKAKYDELCSEKHGLVKELDKLKIKVSSMEKEHEETLARLKESSSKCAELVKEKEKSDEKYSEMEFELIAVRNELSEKSELEKVDEAKHAKLVDENKKLTDELESLDSKITNLEKEHEQKLLKLREINNAKIADIEEQKEMLHKKFSATEFELIAARSALDEKSAEQNEVDKEVYDRICAENERLKTELTALEGDQKNFIKKLGELEVKRSEKEEKVEELANQILALESELESVRNNLLEREAEIERCVNEVNDLQAKFAEMVELQKDVNDNYKAAEMKAKELDEKCNKKEIHIEECNEKISMLEKELNDKKEKFETLQEKYQMLTSKTEDENDNKKLNAALMEIAELKCSVHTHKTLHHKVKGELEEALLTIENSRGDMERVKVQLKEGQSKEAELKKRLEELENDLQSKESKLSEESTCSKVQELEEKLKDSTEELESAEKILSELREVVKRRDEQLQELHCELRNANKTKEKIQGEVEDKDRQIQKLENEIVEKNNELSSKSTEIGSLKGEIDSVENSTIKIFKTQLIELEEQNNTSLKKLTSELENKQRENSDLRKCVDCSEDLIKEKDLSLKELNSKLEKLNKLNEELNREIIESKKLKDAENELRSQLTLKEVECETLTLEIKVLKEDLAKETKESEKVKEQLEAIKRLNGDFDVNSECFEKSDTGCDNKNAENLAEVQRLYQAEKLKNEEYQKLIRETNDMNCLSPQSGIRKLRKEKIEMENALLEAKFKISSHEGKIKELELKLKNSENAKHDVVPTHDPLLQRKLNSVTAKLQETESSNRSLIKEVAELQGVVERLEADLKEEQERRNIAVEKDTPRRSRASILQAELRQSISSPSSKVELTKSREREQELKEKLKEANVTIQEWLEKLAESENKLQRKTQELRHAQDTIQQLETKNSQEGRNINKQIQEYMDQNNNLKLQILKKEGDLEIKSRTIENLQRQLDSEAGLMKSLEKDKQSQEEMIDLLKDTLKEQEDMLQEQEDFLNGKEAELQACQTEHNQLVEKFQTLLESKDNLRHDHSMTRLEAERDLLKQQLSDVEAKFEKSREERERFSSELKEKKSAVTDVEKKLRKITDEKGKLEGVLRENIAELKSMECSLTQARSQIEELKSEGADKLSDMHLEEVKHDLAAKIRNLQCQNKELGFKLSTSEEKVHSLKEEKHNMDHKLKEFREERDKLVSGLEAVLKKKDNEIKQLKDMIKQLKEKEMQLTKSWQEEREQIAAGLQDLNRHSTVIKLEKPDTPGSPTRQSSVYDTPQMRADTPQIRQTPSRQSSRGRPPRPSPPKFSATDEVPEEDETEIRTYSESPGCSRRISRAPEESSSSETSSKQSSGRAKRGGSRRGKKRPSSEGLENLPPLPKRQSKDSSIETSIVSESDDYSSHLQVDATPPVAAKTLRRTRKKNGSQLDISKPEETEDSAPRRSSRNKRSAKHRLLDSFRESPMGRTSKEDKCKRILDSIAETFSPKSPTRSPKKSPLKEGNSSNISAKDIKREKSSSRENLPNCDEDNYETERKKSGRGRGRHKLYKEDAFISEPFESTGVFVQSPEDVHKTVTRSLRSRRH